MNRDDHRTDDSQYGTAYSDDHGDHLLSCSLIVAARAHFPGFAIWSPSAPLAQRPTIEDIVKVVPLQGSSSPSR